MSEDWQPPTFESSGRSRVVPALVVAVAVGLAIGSLVLLNRSVTATFGPSDDETEVVCGSVLSGTVVGPDNVGRGDGPELEEGQVSEGSAIVSSGAEGADVELDVLHRCGAWRAQATGWAGMLGFGSLVLLGAAPWLARRPARPRTPKPPTSPRRDDGAQL